MVYIDFFLEEVLKIVIDWIVLVGSLFDLYEKFR